MMSNAGSVSAGGTNASRVRPQAVVVPLTRDTIFLVVTVNPDAESLATIRSLCGDLPKLLRAVGFRDPAGNLSCVIGFGSEAWDRLFGQPRPGGASSLPRDPRRLLRHAIATPGDCFFHIRAERQDLCFELATQMMMRLGNAVAPADEVHGFRYFDARDLLGFVDGTENPVDQEAIDAALIGREIWRSPAAVTSSYRSTCTIWRVGNALPTEVEERIIGQYEAL